MLKNRRALIAKKLNEFMHSLVLEPETPHHRPVIELISLGESVTLEFKSSLQWDLVQNKQNNGLRMSVIKTVAAFLNTEGGTLVIGVEDQGAVCGIEADLHIVGDSSDRFAQLLNSLFFEYLGAAATPYIRQRFENVDGRVVCVIDVGRSTEPVFAKTEKGREFYVRVGNTNTWPRPRGNAALHGIAQLRHLRNGPTCIFDALSVCLPRQLMVRSPSTSCLSLHLRDNPAQRCTQRFGYPRHVYQSNIAGPPFNVPDVRSMYPRKFS